MLDVLCEHLVKKPELYNYKMANFLWNHFQVHVTTSSIRRALISCDWSKEKISHVAKAWNTDLQDLYLYNTLEFRSYHYVFIDESSYNKQIGFKWMGWSPLGVTLVQVPRFQSEQRYEILPAYKQDSIILAQVF